MPYKKLNFQKLFLLTLSGFLFGFSFPPFKTGVFSFFAFIPLFFVLSDAKGRNFLNAYYTFFVFNLISISWIGGFNHAKDTFLMIGGGALLVIHPFLMSLPIAFFNIIHKNFNFKTAIYCFPFLWVSFEYLHSITEFAFPWLTLGSTLTYDLQLIQLAEYIGVYGLSFWIVLMNVLIFILLVKFVLKEFSLRDKSTLLLISLILVSYLLPKIYGNYILTNQNQEKKETIVKVGIIQPNIDPWEKWNTIKEVEQIDIQLKMSVEIAESSDLIIWPETGIPFYILLPQYETYLNELRNSVNKFKFSLLTGFPEIHFFDSTDKNVPKTVKRSKINESIYATYNSSFLLVPDSKTIQKYSKIRLVPFSERVPYAETLHFLSFLEWDVGISGWEIGKDTTVFVLPLKNNDTVRFSNLICYESIYPSFVKDFVRKGAEFLTIITNDSWWGDSFGPYQHERYAVLRAVENRRWIARCANGGISCFIDPYGNVYNETSMFTQDVIHKIIYINKDFTFYTEKGDLIPEFSLLISIFVVSAIIGKKFYIYVRRKNE